jgi:serine/threonine-protein kinase
MMTATTLTQLARFKIIGELGRGAMGVVYKAHDPALDRTVAIKTIQLPADAAERASYEARFLQEARAAGRLSHPAIITIYDIGREGDLAYIAMEMLHGLDLRERMAQAMLTLREAISLAAQVAEGLGFAHEHGVVHRDIKPANIMIVRGDRAKIMDFGIARLQLSDVKTQTGILLGTPKYMSPEQVAGRPLDHRSDIFSLGAMLYEMWVGRTPFSGADVTQLMHNVASAQHIAPSRILQRLPPVLDLIIARALAKDPAARYQKAQDFAEDLRSAMSELPSTSSGASAGIGDATERLAAPVSGVMDAVEPTQKLRPDSPTRVSAADRMPTLSGTGEAPALWLLSQNFDSSKALERLAQTSAADRSRLLLEPRLPSGPMRLLRDPDLRMLAITILAAVLFAAAIVVY